MKTFLLTVLILPFLLNCAKSQTDKVDHNTFPNLIEPYLGQTPPANQFVRFAPSIVPNDMHCTTTVSPDESYIIFFKEVAGQSYLHISFKSQNNQWISAEIIENLRPKF